MTAPSTEECIDRLRSAGWSVGDAAFVWPDRGLVWLVTGRKGEGPYLVLGEGATEAEAWRAALTAAG